MNKHFFKNIVGVKTFLCLIAFVFLAGCVSRQNAVVPHESLVSKLSDDYCKKSVKPLFSRLNRNSNIICLTGEITDEMSSSLREFLQHTSSHATVILDSPGGSVRFATDIVRALGIGNYDAIVLDGSVCFSSCANYILLAARKKIILDGAYVGWHGGPPRTKDGFVSAWKDSFDNSLTESELEMKWRGFQPVLEGHNWVVDNNSGALENLIYGGGLAISCANIFSLQVPSGLLWSPGSDDFLNIFNIDGFEIYSSFHKTPKVFNVSEGLRKSWEVERNCFQNVFSEN